jgi:uncharacterized protein with von Willebrand factor type A (vWA) domain
MSQHEGWDVLEAEEPRFIEQANEYRDAIDTLHNELKKGHGYVLNNLDNLQSQARQVAREKNRYEAEETIVDAEISELKEEFLLYPEEQHEAAENVLNIYEKITERVRERESRLFDTFHALLEETPKSKHSQLEEINPTSIYHNWHPEEQQRVKEIQKEIEKKAFDEKRREQGDPGRYIA